MKTEWKTDSEIMERQSSSMIPWMFLVLFILVTSALPNLLKENQVNKTYRFSIASALFTANIFISSLAYLLHTRGNFENPIRWMHQLGLKTVLKLMLVRLVHNLDLCLDPIVLTKVTVTDRNVFGPPSGLMFVATLRFFVFGAWLSRTQLAIIALIVLLIFAGEGDKLQNGSFDRNWGIGVALILTCRALQSMGRVSTEKVLKEELQQLGIWQKVFVGSLIDMLLYIPLMFAFSHEIVTTGYGIFEGWTWKTILLCLTYVFQTMLIYNILNLLDTMYLMLAGFTAGLLGVVLSYVWIGEPFSLSKFIIILVLFVLVIGYEVEGMNNAILAKLKEDLDSERKRSAYWKLLKEGATSSLYLPSTRRKLNEIFGSIEEIHVDKSPRASLRYSLELEAPPEMATQRESIYFPSWTGNYTFV